MNNQIHIHNVTQVPTFIFFDQQSTNSYTSHSSRNFSKEQKLRLWIQKTILKVVLSIGGDLVGCDNIWDETFPSRPSFNDFLGYENWALMKIKTFQSSRSFLDEDESQKIIITIFPMFYTNKKDKSNTIEQLYNELTSLLNE